MSWTVLCCKFISVSLHRCSNGKDALCSSRCGIGKHHYIYMTLMKRRWARLFSKTSCRYNPCPHIWFMQWLISASFSNQIENSLHQLVEVFWCVNLPTKQVQFLSQAFAVWTLWDLNSPPPPVFRRHAGQVDGSILIDRGRECEWQSVRVS